LLTADFDYELPPEYIAQSPIEPRDASKLLVLDRKSKTIQHTQFHDIGSFINPGDVLVLNKTRVIPARIYAKKLLTGGSVELLLLRRENELVWEVLVGGKGLYPGKKIRIEDYFEAEIIADKGGSRRLIKFTQPVEKMLPKVGHVPLPPYIHEPLENAERYQTIYAQEPGSVAAPTAGLHFTERLISELQKSGIRIVYVTLHIGLDTFAPVTESNPSDHIIHTEWCQITDEVCKTINQSRVEGHKIIAIGTSSVRVLESAAIEAGSMGVTEFYGPTNLYILPGYKFKVVDGMVTNFHLPKSTLIMLVSAFAGRDLILSIYQVAKDMNYRFYSFGDAMLIL
jgi:S-adenosylmethionine:tRNA ribosyltransferase-isomerase